MSLLTMFGIVLVIVGVGLLGLSARYFYLGLKTLYFQRKFNESIYQRS